MTRSTKKYTSVSKKKRITKRRNSRKNVRGGGILFRKKPENQKIKNEILEKKTELKKLRSDIAKIFKSIDTKKDFEFYMDPYDGNSIVFPSYSIQDDDWFDSLIYLLQEDYNTLDKYDKLDIHSKINTYMDYVSENSDVDVDIEEERKETEKLIKSYFINYYREAERDFVNFTREANRNL
jgi:hypothetical protein